MPYNLGLGVAPKVYRVYQFRTQFGLAKKILRFMRPLPETALEVRLLVSDVEAWERYSRVGWR